MVGGFAFTVGHRHAVLRKHPGADDVVARGVGVADRLCDIGDSSRARTTRLQVGIDRRLRQRRPRDHGTLRRALVGRVVAYVDHLIGRGRGVARSRRLRRGTRSMAQPGSVSGAALNSWLAGDGLLAQSLLGAGIVIAEPSAFGSAENKVDRLNHRSTTAADPGVGNVERALLVGDDEPVGPLSCSAGERTVTTPAAGRPGPVQRMARTWLVLAIVRIETQPRHGLDAILREIVCGVGRGSAVLTCFLRRCGVRTHRVRN